MAPNSFVKSSSVHSECESDLKELQDSHEIRTDFIIQNIYSHMLKSAYYFEAISAANKDEENLLYELKRIVDDFKFLNGSKIQALCSDLVITVDTLGTTVFGVSNELFVEGVTWSRIIGLFVFVSELTIQSIAKNISDDIVEVMYECFSRVVKETLKSWIDDHGGWKGVLCLKVNKSRPEKPDGWAQNILRKTASVIGTIAHITNLPY